MISTVAKSQKTQHWGDNDKTKINRVLKQKDKLLPKPWYSVHQRVLKNV